MLSATGWPTDSAVSPAGHHPGHWTSPPSWSCLDTGVREVTAQPRTANGMLPGSTVTHTKVNIDPNIGSLPCKNGFSWLKPLRFVCMQSDRGNCSSDRKWIFLMCLGIYEHNPFKASLYRVSSHSYQDCHISFCVGNCDSAFHLDKTLSTSFFIINLSTQ